MATTRKRRPQTVGEVVAERDRSTPRMRKWLDRYQQMCPFPRSKPIDPAKRRYYYESSDEKKSGWIVVVLSVPKRGKPRLGVIAGTTLQQIKKNVIAYERKFKRENEIKDRNSVGRYI